MYPKIRTKIRRKRSNVVESGKERGWDGKWSDFDMGLIYLYSCMLDVGYLLNIFVNRDIHI